MNASIPHNSILKMITKLAFALTTAAMVAVTAHAESKMLQNLDKTGVAVQGYDVVAYFTDDKPVKGDAKISSQRDGATYYFATAEHKAAFDKSPAKYVPEFGGYCAYGVAKNALVKIDPKAFQVVNGRLLLQYDLGVRNDFSKDVTGNLSKADANWPGLLSKKGK
jgi:YHS domain-containing protein